MADAVIGSAYLQVVPKFDDGALKSGMASAGKSGSGAFSSAFSSGVSAKTIAIGNIVSNAVIKGVSSASRAVTDVFVKAFESYADYEQLTGGIETLFGDTAEQAMRNAQNAFKSAGISANEYMEQVNSFAASLRQSLGDENAWQLANYADQAVQDMADNANKMGTNMRSIQDAYQGFAKQNYTMLDNLKLGYGGTKKEMERLLRDAEKLEGFAEGSLSAENFADVVTAIHAIQEELGITGTTAEEAAHTISGSVNMMKAAWSNWLVGVADDNADMGRLTDELVESVGTVIDNALPRIQTIAERIGPAISDTISGLLESISPDAAAVFDKLSAAAGKFADGIGRIAEAAVATGVVDNLADAFSNLADIIASADLGPVFDTLASALRALKDLKFAQEMDEAANALKNMGEIPDLTNAQSWHNGTQAVIEWNRQVEQAGLTTEEYRKLTDREMTQVSRAFETNGNNLEKALNSVGYTIDETTGHIIKFNEEGLEGKRAKVELDDGQLVDAQGHVYTWDGTELLDKDGNAVVDDVSLIDAQGNIYIWNKTDLIPKRTYVQVDGANAISNIINMWERWQPTAKNAIATAMGNFFGASGGFYKMHADGGFVTNGAMSLGVDRFGINHIVGEAGREWVMTHADGTASVVPIENRKYLKPYASVIASMIEPGSNGQVYNITVNAAGDGDAIAREVTRAIRAQNLMSGRR